MKILISLFTGYLFGCISPAAILSRRKHVNLKREGTKNLGATNTALVLGCRAGVIVLLVDIMKSILSAKLVKIIFPETLYIGMVASIGCILGHCYPVFMDFHGGKGLAAFAGMVLEYRLWFAFPIVIPGLVLIVILNTGVAAPMWGCILFPILVAFSQGSTKEICLAFFSSCIIVWTHRDNLRRAFARKENITVRDYLDKVITK